MIVGDEAWQTSHYGVLAKTMGIPNLTEPFRCRVLEKLPRPLSRVLFRTLTAQFGPRHPDKIVFGKRPGPIELLVLGILLQEQAMLELCANGCDIRPALDAVRDNGGPSPVVAPH
jgi:hypothetical protein